MTFDLDAASPVPLYLQIVEEVRRLLAIGALRPGERFLTVRELGARARVNRNTAARAIQQLERVGVVRTRVGQGTFLLDGAGAVDRARVEAEIDTLLDRLIVEAHSRNLAPEELGRRLERRLEAFRRQRDAQKKENSR